MHIGDRTQAIRAQDLRPQVGVSEMLRREVAQRVALLDPDRDLAGLRERAMADRPAATQRQPYATRSPAPTSCSVQLTMPPST